ncbi:DODA-type extradiol aromatic ring-opening family dioxygenase [Plasticicumulans acidivorans]|uniref:4,5-DOPA dioxygenase extradiol n=1 Tax=Plasticicumulans acidivorans TaxID=886464 RepID=A0A317N078_9GAMM|nr:class III extradiol ring-cleavage dioxygenase [Plasticicumulans acidivorans]PWV65520.1 4,5-DOPA dioxygenase extradiol [Plasticicumulans acidivorans]
MLPTLFISHGSPMLPLLDTPARHFLEGLAVTLPRPRAILVASAHWETLQPTVNAVSVNQTIHDFYGFPQALFEMQYPAPGSSELADQISDLLCAAGLPCRTDTRRGLDHGAWSILRLIYPQADIPVVQISLQRGPGPAHHLQLGRALASLRERDVLVIGSGSFTHDLSRFRGQNLNAPSDPDIAPFCDWMDAALREGRTADLLTYRHKAPFAVDNHPTEEHLLPLFVALGAAGEGAKAERIHNSNTYGMLRMDAYAFQ